MKLADCPHCGGCGQLYPETLWSPGRNAWLHAVQCLNVTCEAFGPLGATHAAAEQLWNERARKPIAAHRMRDLFVPDLATA